MELHEMATFIRKSYKKCQVTSEKEGEDLLYLIARLNKN